MGKESVHRRIKILRESEARKIAAGEVIDRPLSLVRELLDNAIDAGATSIEVYIEGGGMESVRVVDDGCGMGKEDLELCCLPHATSKIEQIEDLLSVTSLGFRGEALASIASCSRLSITSSDGKDGGRLIIHGGELIGKEDAPLKRGTVVEAKDLFFNMPARKKFMKSAAAEGAACKAVFLEKSLPFPQITFRYFADGEMKLFLPASGLIERVSAGYAEQFEPAFISEAEKNFGNFSLKAVLGGPSLFRRDRKLMQVYVNGRRIQEFSLLQAIEYGYTGYLPGGQYPIAFVFITIDPALIDFNIHPAKREVRFKNLPEVHHGIVTAVKAFLPDHDVRSERRPSAGPEFPLDMHPLGERKPLYHPGERPPDATIDISKVRESLGTYVSEKPAVSEIHYIGQAMGLFLIAEGKERLFIIDQHAAHERILFDELCATEHPAQPLLEPLPFEVDKDGKAILIQIQNALLRAGVEIIPKGTSSFELMSLPAGYGTDARALIELLSDPRGTEDELLKALFADMACKKAIKDGEILDRRTGEDLARRALSLPIPRCPHGRPIWYEVSRDELFVALKRIV